MTDPARQTPTQVFAIPALLAALSLFGLVASLIGDGAWDTLGALALLVPAGVALVKLSGGLPPRKRPGQRLPAMRRSYQG